jgi:hypothetical protein
MVRGSDVGFEAVGVEGVRIEVLAPATPRSWRSWP